VTARVEVAVGGVVVRGDDILLVLRGRGAGTGFWSVPGGRVEFGETLVEAVVREVREETGIDVTVGRFLGWAENMGDDPEPFHYVILDFLAEPADPDAEPHAMDDAADARWVPRSELPVFKLVPDLADFLQKAGIIS
jgi:ADP-ribose pyrophosphatase YjhB (NUDIX family)